MSWDPSMSTTPCRVCGHSVEAWIDTCDTCLEQGAGAIYKLTVKRYPDDTLSIIKKEVTNYRLKS